MHRAFSFSMATERSRYKERLEASLAGLCELELRKQRQECLILGALALGGPMPENTSSRELSGFNTWGQENLTLRRQLSALQGSPWGLMLSLEQQVGELRVDTGDVAYEGCQGDTGDSRPSSGFYESSEGQSPKGLPCSSEVTEPASPWAYTNERPKSLDDALTLNIESVMEPTPRSTLPRSFSAPYPPLEGIAEEGTPEDPWLWDPHCVDQDWHGDRAAHEQEDYQHALRVEGYILGLIQRYSLSPRPCQPRTSLTPDPTYPSVSRQSSLRRRTPARTPERRTHDPCDLSPDPQGQAWGCDPLGEEDGYRGTPPPTEDCYITLPYPPSRPHSLAEGLPPPLDPSYGAPDPCCGNGEPQSSQNYALPHFPASHNHVVSAHYIPSQTCHAPVCSPMHFAPEPPKPGRGCLSPAQPTSKPRSGGKKNYEERQNSKRTGHNKTSYSQSENSLLGQRGLPERRYSTTERPQSTRGQAQTRAQAGGPHPGHGGGTSVGRRWCSNVELSQDEGEAQGGQVRGRPSRRARHDQACPHSQTHPHPLAQTRRSDLQERAPLCRAEDGYARAAPGESESSMSEVYSPGSSSPSSDSDESGGLVWPQQLPPRLVPSSSSSSSSPQASSMASPQSKTFVKIKASHALKKKILRFRSGSLKVMTTV